MKHILIPVLMYFTIINSIIGQDRLLSSEALEESEVFYNINDALIADRPVYRLNIRQQNFYNLPKELFLIDELQFVNAMKNNLMDLPPGISELKQLQEFILRENRLRDLPYS